MKRWATVFGFMALMCFAPRAVADVLPGREAIERHCTKPEQCAHGTACPRVTNSIDHRDDPAFLTCQSNAERRGLEKRCSAFISKRVPGAVLFCPKGETGTWEESPSFPWPGPAAAPKADAGSGSGAGTKGCTGCAIGGEGGAPPLAVTLAALSAVILRMRRARRAV